MEISDNARRSNELLVQELERLVSAGATGTLFVRTPDDHLGCVVVANGEIVSVTIRGSRGVKGVDYLRSVGHSNFHFDEGTLLWEDPGDLPDTQGILRMLENADSPQAVTDNEQQGESDVDFLFDEQEPEEPTLARVVAGTPCAGDREEGKARRHGGAIRRNGPRMARTAKAYWSQTSARRRARAPPTTGCDWPIAASFREASPCR